MLLALTLSLECAGAAFQESGGLVVMEGENFHASSVRTDPNGVNWQTGTAVAGYVGAGYVDTPATATTAATWSNGCEVSYNVNFGTTGTYVVWVRRYAESGTQDSSFYGLNGTQGTGVDNATPYGSWVWKNRGTITVGTAGVHTFQLRRREREYKVDRILLTTDTNFTPTGNGPAESSQGGAFQQSAGMVVMEGENFHASAVRTDPNGTSWQTATSVTGYVGAGYVDTPLSATTQADWTNGCEISYNINFTSTGNHVVWLRRYAADAGTNSVHHGMDGVQTTGVDNTTNYGAWVWKNLGTVNVSSTGQHTFQLRRREKGYKVDRILLTTNTGYTPTGNGPAESSQGGGAPSAPAAPSGLTATTISNSQINLAWTDNSSDETGFKVDRKTGAGGTYSQIATPGANATSYNNTGLSAGTTYYYRVRAYNGSGDSAYSNEANATTQAAGGPPTPNPLTTHSPVITVQGEFNGVQYKPSSSSDGRVYDAGIDNRVPAPAVWRHDNQPGTTYYRQNPVVLEGQPNAAMVGGALRGFMNYDRSIPYNSNTNSAAVLVYTNSTNFEVFGVNIQRAWDGIRFATKSNSVIGVYAGKIRHCRVAEGVDDAIDSVRGHSLDIEDCLVGPAFVGVAMDFGSGYSGGNHYASAGDYAAGVRDVISIRRTLIWIERELSLSYSSGGTLFKTHSSGPGVRLINCVLRVEHVGTAVQNRDSRVLGPNQTKLRESSGNVFLWTGPGSFANSGYPASAAWLLANGFTQVLEGSAALDYWNQQEAAWLAAHQWLAPLP